MSLLNAGCGGCCLRCSAMASTAAHRQVGDERLGRCALVSPPMLRRRRRSPDGIPTKSRPPVWSVAAGLSTSVDDGFIVPVAQASWLWLDFINVAVWLGRF